MTDARTDLRLRNEDAEQAVLAAMLIDAGAVATARGALTADDFLSARHRLLYGAMTDIAAGGSAVDPLTLASALGADLQLAGGKDYIGFLVDAVPTAANVRYHAELVRECAARRRLLETIQSAALAITTGADDSLTEIAGRIQASVSSAVTKGGRKGYAVVTGDEIIALADSLSARREAMAAGRIVGVATGYPEIDDVLFGLRPAEFMIVAARPKCGKAQPYTAPVLLADGTWSALGRLSVGDKLASVDGGDSVVVGLYPQGQRDLWRVRFSDGAVVECCGDHLWQYHYRQRVAVVDTELLAREVALHPGRISIPLVCGDFGRAVPLPIDPYVLGALLGDGGLSSSSVHFTKRDPEVLRRVGARLPAGMSLRNAGRDNEWRIVGGMQTALRSLGLKGTHSHDKFIPSQYLSASKAQRLDLLRGLLDTDGWTQGNGGVWYSTTSPRLRDDVMTLVRSLGGVVSTSHRTPHYTHNGERRAGRVAHGVGIKGGAWLLSLLTLDRHTAHLPRSTRREPRRTVVAVERCTERADMACIAVSHPSHLYVTNDYVLTHNTSLCLNIAVNAITEGEHAGGFVSTEMLRDELLERAGNRLARLTTHQTAAGYVDDREVARFATQLSCLAGKLHIDDEAFPTLDDVIARSIDLKARHPEIAFLVVDYLQRITKRLKGRRGDEELAAVTTGLKSLAKELRIPIIAPAQVNYKDSDKRESKAPTLADIQGGSSFAQDGNFVFLLHRPALFDADPSLAHVLQVELAASRRTKNFTTKLDWHGDFMAIDSPLRRSRRQPPTVAATSSPTFPDHRGAA